MSLVICPKCTKDYKYQSVLLKHLKNSSRCLSTEEEIKSVEEFIRDRMSVGAIESDKAFPYANGNVQTCDNAEELYKR